MITIYKGTVKSDGACNFCSRGEHTKNHKGLKYLYYNVYVISGNTLKFCLCFECMKILKEQTK